MASNNENVQKGAYFIYRLTLGEKILSKEYSKTLEDLVLEQASSVTFNDNEQNKVYNVTLCGVKVNKKIYQPTEIEVELDFIPKENESKTSPSLEAVSALLLQRKVKLEIIHANFETDDDKSRKVEEGNTYLVAENCYVYEIDPLLKRSNNAVKLYVKLNIFSMDKLMTLNKYSKAYVARKLGSGILKPESLSFGTTKNADEPLVKTNIKDLKFLKYNETVTYTSKDNKKLNAIIPSEFIQPYLVQYNESFYDFLVRTANRCGEFLYFEDGALTLGLPDSGDAIQINEFDTVTKQKISSDPLVIEARARDSMKNEAGKVEDLNHTVIKKESTGFPKDAFAEQTVSNAELANDEYFFPLFKDKFTALDRETFYNGSISDNTMSHVLPLTKTFLGNETAGGAGFGASLGKEAVVTEGILAFTGWLQVGTVNDEMGKTYLDPYKGKVEQSDNDKVVQFSSLKEEGWTTIKYYNDIHKHESEQQRQIVCIDMGTNYVNVKLGQKIRIDGLSGNYVVIQVRMISEDNWDRDYDKYDTQASDRYSDRRSQKIYAIPSYRDANDDQKEKFIPPVHPVPVIRKSGPQTAFVTDNVDPKFQGRVRVAYPWQTLAESLKNDLSEAEQRLEIVQEEKRNLEMAKDLLPRQIVELNAELKELQNFANADAEGRQKMLEGLYAERQAIEARIKELEADRAKKDETLAKKEAEIEAMKNDPSISIRKVEVKEVELEIYRRDLMASEIKDIEAEIAAKKKELEKIDEREANMKAAAVEHDDPEKPNTVIAIKQKAYEQAASDHKNYAKKMAAMEKKVKDQEKEIEKVKKYIDETILSVSTPWIRIASPMATPGGGAFFRPRVGDEVLINFDSDNVERPYVVGSLFSKNTLTPDERLYRKASPQLQWKNISMQIMSPNGHHLTFTDPPVGASFISNAISPGMGFYATVIPGLTTLNGMGEKYKDLAGGIHIGDRYGLYEIQMTSHKRSIDINSPFGSVNINAFSGITISAPNGNVTIKGKNITLEAGNKISMVSGKNIEPPDIGDPEGRGNKIGKKVVGIIDAIMDAGVRPDFIDAIVDFSLIRHVAEVFARPVDGTMLLKSKRFLKLEAGPGNATIRHDRYKNENNIASLETFYKMMLYYVDYISGQVDQFFAEYDALWKTGNGNMRAYKNTEGYRCLRPGKEPDIVSVMKDQNAWAEDLITLEGTFMDGNTDRFHPHNFRDEESIPQVKNDTLMGARAYAYSIFNIKAKVASFYNILNDAIDHSVEDISLKVLLINSITGIFPDAMTDWQRDILVKDKMFKNFETLDEDFFSMSNKIVVKRKLILAFLYNVGHARFNLMNKYIKVDYEFDKIKKTHVLKQDYYWKRQVDIIDHKVQKSKLLRAIWEHSGISIKRKFFDNFKSFDLHVWGDKGKGEILFSDHEDSTLNFEGTGLHEEKDANIGTMEHLRKVLMEIKE